MTTATFSSKRSMYLGAMRRNMPIGIFYTVLLTAFFPLMYIMTLMTSEPVVQEYGQLNRIQMSLVGSSGIYSLASVIAVPLICAVMPIVFGALFFSYLHSKRAVDVYHALPMKRQDIFSAHYFAGLTMLCIPLILCYVIILIAGAFQSAALGEWYNPGKILLDLLVWLVGIIAIYSITAATAVFGGTTLDTVLYALAMCGMYPVLIMLAKAAVSETLLGFNYQFWETGMLDTANLLSFSPFTLHIYRLACSPRDFATVNGGGRMLFNGIAVAVWALIAAALFFAVRELYVRRKSELAGRSAPASLLSKIAQYALVFASATILGILMGEGFKNSVSALIGVVIGGGIAYATFEAVVARGFRTFPKAFVHMGISVALPLVFFVVLLTGGLGYENRIPAVDQVESVSINYSGRFHEPNVVYVSEARSKEADDGEINWWSNTTPVVLTNPEAIEIVRQYHSAVIQEAKGRHWMPERDWKEYANFTPVITYRLKNGNTVQRRYNSSTNETVKALAGLEDMDEFREQTNPAFLAEADDLSEIAILNRMGIEVDQAAKEQYQALLEALRTDAKNETLKDMLDGTKATLGYIQLTVDSEKDFRVGKKLPEVGSEILITEGYTNTIAWLKANGMYDKIQIDVDQIKSAAIIEFDRFSGGKFRERSSDSIYFSVWPIDGGERAEYIFKDYEQYGAFLLEDKADIEKLLAVAKNYGSNTGEDGYWVYFRSDSKTSMSLFIAESQMPEELVQQYQEAYPVPQG